MFVHKIFYPFNRIWTGEFAVQTLNTFNRKLDVFLFWKFLTPLIEFEPEIFVFHF